MTDVRSDRGAARLCWGDRRRGADFVVTEVDQVAPIGMTAGHRFWVRVGMAAGVRMTESGLARVQGSFYIASGLWPLLHRRSFEGVFGPKQDYWLAATVALLLFSTGAVQLRAPATPDGVASARRIGILTAIALASVDAVNVGRGRISRTYLIDAVGELGWLWAWNRVRTHV